MNERLNEQPEPAANGSKPVWDLVIEDMHARDQQGRAKHGVPLQANNGRDVLFDAYQEALDLCVYLRQAIEERKAEQIAPDDTELRQLAERIVKALRGGILDHEDIVTRVQNMQTKGCNWTHAIDTVCAEFVHARLVELVAKVRAGTTT